MRLILAAAATAAMMSSAQAQDAAYDWSGAYIGAQAGHVWGRSAYISPTDGQSAYPKPRSAFGGLHAGYNFAFTYPIILGVEADLNWTGTGSDRANFGPAFTSALASAHLNWVGSVRARIGYGMGRLMPHLTAGVAVVDWEHRLLDPAFTDPLTVTRDTKIGWTAGVGIDYAVTNSLIAGIEYRYSDFGKVDYPGEIIPGFIIFPHQANLSTQDLRFKIAYKF